MIAKIVGFFRSPKNKICPHCKGEKCIDVGYDYEPQKIEDGGGHVHWEKVTTECTACGGSGLV